MKKRKCPINSMVEWKTVDLQISGQYRDGAPHNHKGIQNGE
ncbi:MAG: hypothetical protein ACTSWK_00190 [Promethearchaeota archaeon]